MFNLPVQGMICLLFCLIGVSCDPLEVEPGEFAYPLELSATQQLSVTTLNWSEATVSTFEEYIILRSTLSIPDSPEPEVDNNTVIVARVDDRRVTTLQDVNAPISNSLFYKVYAKIAGRFLMSPTIAHDQNLDLIPRRTDVSEPIPGQGLLIGYDRLTKALFVYDYENREILRSEIVQQYSVPVIRYNASVQEILIAENGSVAFYDFNTLDLKQTFFIGTFRDVQYKDSWIYVESAVSPYPFALYRRSDFSLRSQLSVLQADWRKSFVHINQAVPFDATIYDFGTAGAARYRQQGASLTLDLSTSGGLPGSVINIADNPAKGEFVVSNSGTILDGNLQQTHIVDNGQFSYSFFSYAPDGKTLYGLTFLNSPIVRMFDTDDNYSLIEEHLLSNQISPVNLFTDATGVRVVSLVFADGLWKTLITTIGHP